MHSLGNITAEQLDAAIRVLERNEVKPVDGFYTIYIGKDAFIELGGTEEEWEAHLLEGDEGCFCTSI